MELIQAAAPPQPPQRMVHRLYSDDFLMWTYKVEVCARGDNHDWARCPYAHDKEKARRRDPRRYNYASLPCPDAMQGRACPRGDACPYTHCVQEYWLHPDRFKTQMCKNGARCNRPLCFFAHAAGELRFPDPSGNVPAACGAAAATTAATAAAAAAAAVVAPGFPAPAFGGAPLLAPRDPCTAASEAPAALLGAPDMGRAAAFCAGVVPGTGHVPGAPIFSLPQPAQQALPALAQSQLGLGLARPPPPLQQLQQQLAFELQHQPQHWQAPADAAWHLAAAGPGACPGAGVDAALCLVPRLDSAASTSSAWSAGAGAEPAPMRAAPHGAAAAAGFLLPRFLGFAV
ncbi:hypothetical protein Rsub_06755 [Raphidocelis subcapitata]|uniref:C3H1-type domain-containing protein n=1 Tax=Raphidocelis subcapitata TaxID=307507 RepID=A0A2V0P417_9CHLO|nr:hypothetical protein Rsub_06755 [Raphidocelis subcapitata]|eukprot:GBF93652.1 hypothetical protein Rsub_06755 [Raphidocelis subcapitata]